jgi:amino acid transporter
VNRHTGTPIRPAVVVGALTVGLLYLNVHNAAIFLALSSVCIMLLYIAYLMVTGPMLLRRLQGWPREVDARTAEKGLFSLGRWAIPVNVVAVVWGLLMAVNLGWPRAKVFGTSWYLQYFPELFLAGTVVVGAGAYVLQRLEMRREAAALDPEPGGVSLATAIALEAGE